MRPYKPPPTPLVGTRKEPPTIKKEPYVPTSPPATLRLPEKKYKLPPSCFVSTTTTTATATTATATTTSTATTNVEETPSTLTIPLTTVASANVVPLKIKLPPQSVHYQGRRTIFSNVKELPLKRKEPPTKIAQVQKPPRKRNKKEIASADLCFGDTSITLPVYEDVATPSLPKLPPDMLTKRHVVNTLTELIGQNDAVVKAREWIESYAQKSSSVSKALLVVGPSGCGKTSLASCTLTDHEYKLYNFSCDDFDGQKMGEIYTIVNRSSALEKFGVLLEDVNTLKAETQKLLVEIINGKRYEKQFGKKHWHAPMVMTCDLSSLPSLGPLAAVSEVVQLQRLQDEDLQKMFNHICEMETLCVENSIRDKAVKACGGDVRRLLNMLQFFALAEGSTSLGQIDVSTIFYEQYSNFDLANNFIRLVRDKTPLPSLSDIMDIHPISLSSLLSQNYTKFFSDTPSSKNDTLEKIANVSDHISFSEQFEHIVYKEGDWELQECATVLGTWGIATLLPRTMTTLPSLDRSDYFSWKEKAKHRKKLLVACSSREGAQGLDLIDTSFTWCEMIKKHTSKVVQQEMVDYFNKYQYSYKDVQNIWKISHMSDATMPNPRGKNSLRKLLKIK